MSGRRTTRPFPAPCGEGRVARRANRGGGGSADTLRQSPPPGPRGPARGSRSPPQGGGKRAASGLVLLGEFGRAHGLDGQVRLNSYTDDPLAIGRYGPLLAADGRRFKLTDLRPASGDQPDMLVARIEGVRTREAAEALNRLALHVERERLGEPEDDEFYLADLVGLRVDGPDGPVGRIVAVPNYGGGELLEIELLRTPRTVLLPFTRAFVPEVDVPGGRVVIAPPLGLFDEEPDGRRRTAPVHSPR